MKRVVLYLAAAILIIAGCSSVPILFEDDGIQQNALFLNTDERTSIWIHNVNQGWVNLVLILDGVEGQHRGWTTIENLRITLASHWRRDGIVKPLDGSAFLDPPPHPNTPLSEYVITGGVILDGSAALAAIFEDNRFMEYRGQWIPATETLGECQRTATPTVGWWLEQMGDVNARPRVIVYRRYSQLP